MNWKKITTVGAAFAVHGLDPKQLPIVDHLPERFQKRIIADYILHVAAEAINTDDDGTVWVPDYTDGSWKYEAAWGIEADAEHPAGSGFSRSDYVSWRTLTCVGSRLCFPTLEKLEHFQEHFMEQHLDHMLYIKK